MAQHFEENSYSVCMLCYKSCSHTCSNCGNPVCTACGMKETDCKRFACPECITPYICQPDDVPHIHGYPYGSAQELCTCQTCANIHPWNVDGRWKKDKDGNIDCPVSNIVNDLMKHRLCSKALDVFLDGLCDLPSSSKLGVGHVVFCGDDKQKHEDAWTFAFEHAKHEWEERYSPNSSAQQTRKRHK